MARRSPSAGTINPMVEQQQAIAPVNVLVVGMHRSGTSAIANLLAAAGLSSGTPDHEMQAKFDNPLGHGERLDVVKFDDDLMGTLGWFWDSPPAKALPSPPDRPAFVSRGRALVRDALAGPRPWVVKDPRMSLLLPWWRKILVDRFVVVLPWRPIEEIVWSLALRDDFSHALGVALTAAYLRHLAVGMEGLPVVLVDYAALTERTSEVVPELLESLRQQGVRCDFDVDAAVAAVDPVLRRTTQPGSTSVDSVIEPETRQLVQPWIEGAVGSMPRFAREVSEPPAWETALLDLQRHLRGVQQVNSELRRRLRAASEEHNRSDRPVEAGSGGSERADPDSMRSEPGGHDGQTSTT